MIYDVTSGNVLDIGYKYDFNTQSVQFTGFTPTLEDSVVYLKWYNGSNYMIPLTDDLIVTVGTPITDISGRCKGQLVEIKDGALIANSNVFAANVAYSLPQSAETEVSDGALRLLYSQMYEQYQAIVEQAAQFATLSDLQEEVGDAIEAYLIEHPIEAPVTSVNGEIGAVVLDADDVGALPSDTEIPSKTSDLTNDSGFINSAQAPVQSVNGQTGNVTISIPTALPNPKALTFTGAVSATYDGSTAVSVTIPQGGGGAVDSVNGKTGVVVLDADDVGALPDSYTAPVTSVNSKTGAVTLSASDVGALPSSTVIPTESTVAGWGFTKNTGTYSKPSGGIPATDLAAAVQTSLGKADTALQTAPVTSVNGNTGAVTIAVPTKTSDLTNDSGYITSAPVTSVNGQTGAVTLSIPTKTSDLTNDSGYITSAPVTSVNGQTGAVTGLQTTANLVTSVSSSSTNSQYPSAKLFYDTVGDIETLLAAI